jgi:hypothetical protein
VTTGESSWHPPASLLFRSCVRLQRWVRTARQHEVDRAIVSRDASQCVDVDDSVKKTTHDAWKAYLCEETSVPYWYNHTSGEANWYNPAIAACVIQRWAHRRRRKAALELDSAVKIQAVARGHSARAIAKRQRLHFAAVTRARDHAWVRYEDDERNAYFFNHETAQSVWNCPLPLTALHAIKLQRWLRKSRLSHDRGMAAVGAQPPSGSEWTLHVCEITNTRYFYNGLTDTSTWEAPASLLHKSAATLQQCVRHKYRAVKRERASTRMQAIARGRRARAQAAMRRRENRSRLMKTHASLLKAVKKLQLEVRTLKVADTSSSALLRRRTTTLTSDDASVLSGYNSGHDESSTLSGSQKCTALAKPGTLTDTALLDIARSLEEAITDARRDVRVTHVMRKGAQQPSSPVREASSMKPDYFSPITPGSPGARGARTADGCPTSSTSAARVRFSE